MRLLYYYLFVLQGLLCHQVAAQLPETYWTTPDGKGRDFTDTFKIGDEMNIAWEGWNSSYIGFFLGGADIVDLWVMTYELANPLWTEFLQEGIDVRKPGGHQWKINIPDDILSQTSKYSFRFLIPGQTINAPDDGVHAIPSFGFLVLPEPAPAPSPTSAKPAKTTDTTKSSSSPSSSTTSPSSSTASSSSSSPTASGQSATTSASSAATSGATSTAPKGPDPSDSITDDTSKSTVSSGLTQGAKIGIGIGSAFAAIAGLALLIFALRYNRGPPQGQYQDLQDLKPADRPGELHGHTAASELLDVHDVAYRAELPAHQGRI